MRLGRHRFIGPRRPTEQRCAREGPIRPDVQDRFVDGGGMPSPPTPLPRHRTPDNGLRTFNGPLFVGRVEAADVEQGAVADCFIAAALAATAELRPAAIRDAITPTGHDAEGHRTFDVQLFERGGERKTWPVDDRLFADPLGQPVYGRWPEGRPQELWFPLLEKAIIDKLDAEDGVPGDEGYRAGNEGGSAFTVFEALLGAAPNNYRLAQHAHRPDAVLELIETALAKREPAVAYTYDKGHAHLYADNGLSPWHTYAILGVDRAQGTLRMYNPWSEGELGHDGKDDGFFEVSAQDFLRFFRNMNIAHDPRLG